MFKFLAGYSNSCVVAYSTSSSPPLKILVHLSRFVSVRIFFSVLFILHLSINATYGFLEAHESLQAKIILFFLIGEKE